MSIIRSTGINVTILLAVFLFTTCSEDKVDPLFLGTIHGIVVTKSTGNPVKEVEITTAPATSVVYSNDKGVFQITDVPEGEYTVITKAEGYSRESIKVKVVRNATTDVGIKLVGSSLLAPAPVNPVPAGGATNQPLSVTLRWSVSNTSGDTLTYNVTVYESNNVTPLAEALQLTDTTLVLEDLKYNTSYYWNVDVVSSTGYVTSGEIWRFHTIPFPDNRIVFVSEKSGNYEVYSSDAAGAAPVRLTYTGSYELKPLFSSKRDLIAFSANKNVDYHIYTINKDGSGIRQVTTLPIAGFHNQGIGFSWSPDNGRFIYSHYNKLYRIDRTGANLTLIATAPANRNFRTCHWTSTGNKIVVETVGSTIYESEIYLMNANGSDTVRLVDDLPGIIQSPSFSIDGREVMYTRDASGYESADGRQLNAHIYIKNIESGELTDISRNKPDGTNDLQPRFSPDGAKIIFVNAPNDGTGKKSIWIMNKDGTERKLLFEDAEMPHWQ